MAAVVVVPPLRRAANGFYRPSGIHLVRTDLRLPQLPMGISWLPACPPPRILACHHRHLGRVEPG
jgi:hypothetical protein